MVFEVLEVKIAAIKLEAIMGAVVWKSVAMPIEEEEEGGVRVILRVGVRLWFVE